MFYPKCPVCGGKVTSAEPNTVYPKHVFSQWLQQQAAAGHAHPYIKIGVTALLGWHKIYKRLPGGGAKRCTDCGHHFN